MHEEVYERGEHVGEKPYCREGGGGGRGVKMTHRCSAEEGCVRGE